MTTPNLTNILSDLKRIAGELKSMRRHFAVESAAEWRIVDQLDQARARIINARLRCETEVETKL